MPDKTNRQRQAALRQRRADAGLAEVRGIYATEDDARQIKQYAKLLAAKKAAPAPQKTGESR